MRTILAAVLIALVATSTYAAEPEVGRVYRLDCSNTEPLGCSIEISASKLLIFGDPYAVFRVGNCTFEFALAAKDDGSFGGTVRPAEGMANIATLRFVAGDPTAIEGTPERKDGLTLDAGSNYCDAVVGVGDTYRSGVSVYR